MSDVRTRNTRPRGSVTALAAVVLVLIPGAGSVIAAGGGIGPGDDGGETARTAGNGAPETGARNASDSGSGTRFGPWPPSNQPSALRSEAGSTPRVRARRQVFPLRGRHSYGDGLHSGRGHQGQDLLTRCGRRVVAAAAGRVRLRDYHGAAGYYLTIAGRGTPREYVYQHLEERGRPKEGTKVRTGQPIGFVGTSGNASTCHLHFELWTAPGSYIGGLALDPAPRLRRWDSWS